MKKSTIYTCEGCGVDYATAEECEKSHIKPVKIVKAEYGYLPRLIGLSRTEQPRNKACTADAEKVAESCEHQKRSIGNRDRRRFVRIV